MAAAVLKTITFNSNMVRLRRVEHPVYILGSLFQIQYGAIKTNGCPYRRPPRKYFQFQYGAIKTVSGRK